MKKINVKQLNRIISFLNGDSIPTIATRESVVFGTVSNGIIDASNRLARHFNLTLSIVCLDDVRAHPTLATLAQDYLNEQGGWNGPTTSNN